MSADPDEVQEWVVRTPEDVARAIRFFRKRAGLTQEALAVSADVHRTYLSGVEMGSRNPPVGVLLRVLRRLGVEVVLRRRGPDDAGA